MLLWLVIAGVSLAAAAILARAALHRPSRATVDGGGNSANEAHFRAQLRGIEADLRQGRLTGAEAEAAKAELAREVVRFRKAAGDTTADSFAGPGGLPLAALGLLSGVLAVATYAYVGSPGMPSLPLAEREMPAEQSITMEEALARVESQLEQTPDDIRGWQVLGPAYMRAGRYEDAERAFSNVIRLGGPEADALTDLAEARLMQAGGVAGPGVMSLLQEAAALDPDHVRSRFYLAGEATREQRWDDAIVLWNALLALSQGDEDWRPVAERGLELAEARGQLPDTGPLDPAQGEQIRAMVEGQSERLFSTGGTVEEWTRLVRSRLVLGETDLAREAYEAAKSAHPDANDTAELDALALEAGLLDESP